MFKFLLNGRKYKYMYKKNKKNLAIYLLIKRYIHIRYDGKEIHYVGQRYWN